MASTSVVRRARASAALIAASRNLRRLELAYAAAISSEWAFVVALGVFAYEHGGARAVGVLGLVRMVPAALATPFTAAFADRYERERSLAGVVLLSGLALAASAALFYGGRSEAAIFAFAAAHAVVSTLLRPAVAALLPSLAATPEQLVGANSATLAVEGFGTLVGPLLAGIVLSVADAGVVFAIGAAAYLASAIALAAIHVEGRLRFAEHRAGGGFVAGFTFLRRHADSRTIVALFGAQSAVRGALNVLVVVVAFQLLHAGGGWVGLLTGAVGAGTLIGGFGTATLTGRRLALPFGLGLVLWGVPIALLAVVQQRAAALVLLAVVGVGNAIEDVSGETLLQRIVGDDYLGRVLGVMFGVATAAMGIGSIAAAALVRGLGNRGALVTVGAFLPTLVLLSWRTLRRIDQVAVAPSKDRALLEDVPMFAQLPLPAKEHLERDLARVRAPAGTTIVEEGAIGDRFYMVASGRLEVTQAGQRLRVCGRGDYFGEVALLHDVPRTATVTAIDESELYALDRASFLAAVTGHRAGVAAGEAVVQERLASVAGER